AGRRQPELAVDGLHQLEGRERRVEDVGGGDLGTDVGKERAQERRLPGADVARDADEPARLRKPEAQVRERLRVLSREEQVPWIRRQPERRINEPEESLVHFPASPLTTNTA